MNRDYLDQIIQAAGAYKTYSSYSYSSGSTYSRGGNGSYQALGSSTYSENDKASLKRFYKALAMKFHPDIGGTEEEMKLLNKLKDEWGV